MIDLETLSTEPNAAILSLGAVTFDIDTRTLGPTFYRTIEDKNGHVSTDTVLWWLSQSKEARSVFSEKRIPLGQALVEFDDWLATQYNPTEVKLWGNGSDFDNIILASAYKRCALRQPWRYHHNCCYRTIRNLFPDVPIEREGTYHNALDDAVTQAKHLIKILAGGAE